MTTKHDLSLSKDNLNAVIQSLNHMLSQTTHDEFHTLTGIAHEEGKTLLDEFQKIFRAKS